MNDSSAAMRELSRKQENSVDAYIRQLRASYTAGNRVILTRTREPLRLIDAIRDYTFAGDLNYKHWDVVSGWTEYVANPNGNNDSSEDDRVAKKDNMFELYPALSAVHAGVAPKENRALNPAGYDKVFDEKGIYLMMYPHPAIADGPAKNPRIIQCIKHYVANFPYCEKMLLLVVPPDFKTPIELEDDLAVIDFDLPSVNERFNTIIDTLSDLFDNDHFAEEEGGENASSFDYWAEVLNASSGLTAKNFQDYLTDALTKTGCTSPKTIKVEECSKLINRAKTEIIKRSDVLEIMEPEPIQNVGGQDLLKGWIANRRNAFTREARQFGVDAPKGMLLVGPPGTGKSLSAKAVANVLGIPLIRFDVARVFNSLVGASEARIRMALKTVDALEPCVLFIDEIDKVFQSGQGGNDSGISSRVLGSLLTWMQETTSQVFVVMSANRTTFLPPELLRKGRLDEIFSVTTPTKDELIEIIKIHLRKRGHADLEIDFDAIAAKADGYVPAEIESAIKETILAAYNGDKQVKAENIIAELEKMVPLSKAFKTDFDEMEKWAKDNARPASSKNRDNVLDMAQADTFARGRGRRKVGAKAEDDGKLSIKSH